MPTNYPGSLDDLPRPTSSTLMTASGFEGHVVIDNLSDAVEAVQAELGTDPAGAQATVKARLEIQDRSLQGASVWLSGGYILSSLSAGTASTTSVGADGIRYVPWWCPLSVTVDRIAIEVTTLQTGANAHLGIYSPDSTTNGPGALLLDAGEIDASSAGVKELTVSQALSGGVMYWLALHNEVTSVAYRQPAAGTSRTIGLVADTTVTTGRSVLTESRAYTLGFPSTASTSGDSNTGLVFWLRRT